MGIKTNADDNDKCSHDDFITAHLALYSFIRLDFVSNAFTKIL